jgi:hypothetical protein
MNKALIIAITCILFIITTTTIIGCKCPKPPLNNPTCGANQLWNGSSCVCDANSILEGNSCTNVGTNLEAIPNIYATIGNNCNDWRDSLIIASANIDASTISIELFQKPSAGITWPGDCTMEISKYSTGIVKDSFEVAYAFLNYHKPSVRYNQPLAMFASMNKSKDTIWARIYTASCFTCTYQLYDYCDKIFVKRK